MLKVRAISLASYELERANIEQDSFYKRIGREERNELEEMANAGETGIDTTTTLGEVT